jgi:hypothetical protein
MQVSWGQHVNIRAWNVGGSNCVSRMPYALVCVCVCVCVYVCVCVFYGGSSYLKPSPNRTLCRLLKRHVIDRREWFVPVVLTRRVRNEVC